MDDTPIDRADKVPQLPETPRLSHASLPSSAGLEISSSRGPANQLEFKLPEVPASHMFKRVHRRECTPIPATPEAKGSGVAADPDFDTSPLSLPPLAPPSPSPSDDSAESDVSSVVGFFSPSDTESARRNRKKRPELSLENPRSGVTAYSEVPDDRLIPIVEISSTKQGRRIRKIAEGSTNGHYLPERKDLQELANQIVEHDCNNDPLTLQTFVELQVLEKGKNS